eukprot:TRINITY_DN8392_c0_g5_i1.p1 TRINITY_DN8392_c0_g5~~TRINITY_DN8392_c0_g5_i1.p1  ORF type:complete len:201 (-),score=40.63 TRINITY_DN8392_c0_g5_i1:277-879(-)
MINYSTRLSYWIATEILSIPDLTQRCKTLSNSIKLAKALLDINDFNGAVSIVSGLSNSSIHRLKRTWAVIKPELQEMFKELEQFFLPKDNYGILRNMTKESKPPKIPFLGLYLKDIMALHEVPTTYISPQTGQEMINFQKLRQIAANCLNIEMYQQELHNFKEDVPITEYIKEFPIITDEDQLFSLSRSIEPKVPRNTQT